MHVSFMISFEFIRSYWRRALSPISSQIVPVPTAEDPWSYKGLWLTHFYGTVDILEKAVTAVYSRIYRCFQNNGSCPVSIFFVFFGLNSFLSFVKLAWNKRRNERSDFSGLQNRRQKSTILTTTIIAPTAKESSFRNRISKVSVNDDL